MDAAVTFGGTEDLVEEAATPSANGLRAPCGTKVLSALDLADVCDDEDVQAPLDPTNHGAIDQVDSRLVTELQQKLKMQTSEAPSSQSLSADAFNANLAAALEKPDMARWQAIASPGSNFTEDLGHSLLAPATSMVFSNEPQQVPDGASFSSGFSNINDQLVLEVQKKLLVERSDSHNSFQEPGDLATGMLAPQNTTKISADMLKDVNDEDEEGRVGEIDLNLVSELQRKLENPEEEDGQGPSEGCRAPQTTVKLTSDMLQGLDDE